MARLHRALLGAWLGAASAALLQVGVARADTGAALHADVAAYVAKGDHLVGTQGAESTALWLVQRLSQLGYTVEHQTFELRQYRRTKLALMAQGEPIAAALQWWPPDAPNGLTVKGTPGSGAGRFAILPVKVGDQSYLGGAVEARIQAAIAQGASAVLLATETSLGADGPYLFNARAQAEPWPVPVLAISAGEGARLMSAPVGLELRLAGHHETIRAANIVARLDRPGTDTAVVISTPYTGWGPCGGERGPGIAMFLAIAAWAREHVPHDIVMVATAGHEVGHSGMARFLESDLAPAPEATALWLHLGASIATYARAGAVDANSATRYALFSGTIAPIAQPHLASAFVPVDTSQAVFGEIADVARAGYPHHLGFAGYGPHHHLPSDTADSTAPHLLSDAWQRLLITVREVLGVP
ncbi:hypothetical protein [Erythrobacter sp. BLCC-B19]|uniref:hypothetical protein n=1 Tax=Erythrobacter sp. BLCC-B19 TaxID=3025315 RepID=UPI00236253F7|nr:hypothetical protein [Erythrobacter sp. BLCC-B19]WDA40830.1 hypothetical protein PS060_14895 [Erythrobacter sp. BLCC-B19]